ncbi:MAG TPA: glycosyltransferase [Streptosporangiaceae bacterium]|nr:glycosyltransferase [Streptosporangiaceae bacterium]
MKIALVTLQGNPFGQTPEAGPDRQDQRLASLVSALAEQDHDVTVYARRDSEGQPEKSKPAPGVTVEHVRAGPAKELSPDHLAPHAAEFGLYLARHWQDDAPDVAHAYFWTSGLAALAGARDLGVPVVQTFLSLQATDPASARPAQIQPARAKARSANSGGAARLRLEPVIARSVRAVLASSSSEMSALARLGVRRDSVRLIPRGVDTGTFSPDGPVAPRGSRPRLLCVAPLAPNQGVDVAVRALADIPEAELVIAGGPEHGKLRGDKAYRALLRLASDLKVRDRVVFHGSVSDDDLPALLRSADLLLDAPTGEPFATVALEAMACGTPVVASAIGSHLDTIIDGTTGLLVPPARPGLIAQRIRTLLATPMLLEGFGIAAVDRARARYSWDRIGQETLAIYERSAA